MINSFENLKKIVSIENMNITKYMKYHKICIYLIDQNNLSSNVFSKGSLTPFISG